jgi:fibronectin-binding autotransporter adhesin
MVPSIFTLRRAAISLAILVFTQGAAAQTWTGVVSGNWGVANNWSPAGVPASNINTQLTFGATANASMLNLITDPNPFILNRLTFNAGSPTYSLSSDPLDFRTNGSAVAPSIMMNSNNNLTIDGAIILTNNLTIGGTGTGGISLNQIVSGAGSLTYSGAGTLSFTASNPNTYTGGTIITSGTLALSGFNSANLPVGRNVTVGNGSGPAQLNLSNISNNTAGTAIGSLSVNGGTIHAPGGLGGDFCLNQLSMTGGTVDLSASPNYVLHFVNAGAGITINSINPGASTWLGGGTSRIQNDTSSPLTIAMNSASILNAGIILSNAGTNPNFVFQGNGSESVRLSNTGNTANITMVLSGLVSNDLSTVVGSSAVGTLGTGTVTLNNANLIYDGLTATSGKPLTLAGAGGAVFVFNPVNLTMTGVMNEANAGAALVVVGTRGAVPSTLTLTANNTYTGFTRIDGNAILAVLTIGNAGAGGVPSPIGASSNAPGNLLLGDTSGPFYRGDLLLTGTNPIYGTDRGATVRGLYVSGAGGAIGVQNAGTTLSWNGKITGAGSFIKTGPGTLVLTNGTNDYSGGTYIEAGTLRTGAISSAGPLNILGGTFEMVNFNQSVTSLSGATGTTVLTNGNTLTVGSGNSSTTFAGNILGGSLTKTGSGVLYLTGLGNTANFTTVGTGAIRVDDMAALGSGALALQGAGDNGGGLLYSGPTATSAKNITLANSSTIQVSAPGSNLTLNGIISESAAGQSLIVTGPFNSGTPSTVTLGGTNTYTGKTEVFGNILVNVPSVTNAGAAGPIGAWPSTDPSGLVLQNGTLVLTGASGPYSTNRGVTLQGPGYGSGIGVADMATTLTVSGQITGPGIFHKTGAGILTLTNSTNNFSGGLFIDEGTVRLDGPSGAGVIPPGTNVTVRAGATLNQAAPVNSVPNPNNPVGTITLDGGTLRMSGNADRYYLNQIVVTNNGGLIDLTPMAQSLRLIFVNPGAAITVNGNATCLGASSYLRNESGGEMPIRIGPGITFTSGVNLFGATANYSATPYRVTGGGTLYLTNAPSPFEGAYVRVNEARLRMDDLTNVTPSIFNLTLDNGTLQYGGPTTSTGASFAVTTAGGTLEVLNAGTTLTLTGALLGTPFTPLTKAGPGTLALTNPANTLGPFTVAAGRLDVPVDAALGQGPITVGPLGTVRYTADAATARTFTLNNGTLEAAAGAALTLNGARVGGGFLRGTGSFILTGGAALNGASTLTSTTLVQTGPASVTNFSNGGTFTVSAGQTLDWNGGTNTSSGRLGVLGSVNAIDFVSNGQTTVAPNGSLNGGVGGLVFGGGSVTNIGIYNPNNGQVTPGGTINIGAGDMRVQGGFVRNNGTITDTGNPATSGRLIIDYGGLVKGAGTIDLSSQIIRINGGQLLAGNSPGLTRVTNFSLVSTGVTGGDFSNSTGIAGPPIGSTGTQLSGFSVFEYGNSTNTGGSAQVQGTPASRAIWQFRTVVDGGDYSTPGVPANFNAAQSFTWSIVRPRSNADVGNPNNITPINTVAQISIFDTATMTTVALNDANLNTYLRFDDSAWNWGTVPVNERGTFAFVLLPDASGALNRVIALTYTPVPEPVALLAVTLGALMVGSAIRRCRRPPS